MIDFKDARVLGYDRTSQYFGQSYRYAVQQHLVIEGFIYNLSNQSGVTGIWSGIDGFVQSAVDYDSVIINGVNFGAGRINSINFTEGNDVRKKAYSVDLTIFSQGDLPSNIADILPNIYLAESFSESFDYSISQDGNHNYKHSVNIKYIKGAVITDPIAAAKTLATVLFNNLPSFGLGDNSAQANFIKGKKTYTENYNQITNECSFTKNFTEGEYDGSFVEKLTQEINTGEDGITTVVESGHIEEVVNFNTAVDVSGASARAGVLMSSYAPNAGTLNSHYVSLEKRINRFARTVDYTVRFSNDPRILDTYSWEYTNEISQGQSCVYTLRESGSIQGLTNTCIRTDRYDHALSAWTSIIKPGIQGRLNTYYTNRTQMTTTLNKVASNERRSIHAGQISYEYTYTDDQTFTSGLNGDMRRVEIETSDHAPVPLVNKFGVVNVGELIQNLGIVKEGKRSITIKILGKRRTALPSYLAEALYRLAGLTPNAVDPFISGCNYSWTPRENTFNFKIEWTYFQTTVSNTTL